MINYLSAGLAQERRNTFMAQAQAARQAKQARLHRRQAGPPAARRSPLRWLADGRRSAAEPAATSTFQLHDGSRVLMLRDGSQVLIRQVQSADAPLLAAGFDQLSARSRQMRFLGGKKKLSAAELRYLTDVDHHDHEALGAVNHRDGRGVGIARYIRHAEDPQAAEIAVTIVDDWHGRGLGTELLTQLADRARQEGIRRFTALVAADNVAMARLLQKMSASLVRRESSTLEYQITLAPGEEHDHYLASCALG